jgi:hypothetical protein
MQGDVREAKRYGALALTVLVGLLLLPLGLILVFLLYPDPPQVREARPFLALDQARGLPTYGRDCLRPEDCDPLLGCLELVGTTGRGICLNTECETDSHCGLGEYCRTLRAMGDGPPVRRCDHPDGERAEGELCAVGLSYEQGRCATGLLCNRGWCGRPCNLQETSSCSEGFFCQQGLDGSSCVPTCESRGCPDGLQCAREAGGIAVCARVRGSDCPDASCPTGSRCTFTNRRLTQTGLSLRMECIAPCGEKLPACPSGRICVADRCLRTCDPQGPDTCYPEERCVHRDDLGVALCKQVR